MHSSELSRDPSAIRALTPEQRERLTDVLDQYLRSLDAGVPPSPDALMAAHPDLAESLRDYLEGLDHLHVLAGDFRHPSEHTTSTEPVLEPDRVRLGDFVLGAEIGRGGMGVVYEAHQVSLDRRVALKILPLAAVLDARQIARFRNEAQAAAQLQHPHIVPIFAVGMDRGVHFYAMQFVDGQSLDKAIAQLRKDRDGVLWDIPASAPGYEPVQEAGEVPAACRSWLIERTASRGTYIRTVIRLGIEAAEALHAAHEYGVVHRDIKPSNLLLDGDGKLWITDFGLARFRHDGSLTRSGDVVGTLRYMSPEQASGTAALVDHRTDIYSLAVTLYELLTLQPAIAGDAAPELLRAIDQREPPRLRRIRPEIPRDLETVVRKGMAKVRDDRYATAQHFADDLRHVLAGEPTVAKPPTWPQRANKWMRRHKRLVGAAVCLGVLAGLGCAVSTLLIVRETVKADRNYARAEENFRAAREVVDRFGAQLAQRLVDVPGASQVRRELLAETLRYYQEFAEQAEGDPRLRADLAMTYTKMAALEEGNGAYSDAIAAHEAARDLYARLAADEPGDSEYRHHLALCWNNLARMLARGGQIEQAYKAHDAAMRIQEQLVRDSEDGQYLGDLALSYNNLGLLQSETGAVAAADHSFQESLRLQGQLAAQDAQDAGHQRNLAATYNNSGGLYLSTDPRRAAGLFQRAVQELSQAAAARPQDLACQHELALSYCNLGSAQSQANGLTAAEAAYEHAITIQADLMRIAPDRRSYRRDLSVSVNNQGLLQSKLGQTRAAEQSFRRALELQELLVAQDPDDIALRSSLAGVYNNLGIVQEELEQWEQAAGAYQQAVEHQQIAYARAVTVTRHRTFLSKHFYNYGRVLRKMGRAEQAIQIALTRRDLWPHEPPHLLAVAEELALASELLSAEPAGAMTKEQGVSLALDTLRQAVARGLALPADFDTNESFASLRADRRYLDLVGK